MRPKYQLMHCPDIKIYTFPQWDSCLMQQHHPISVQMQRQTIDQLQAQHRHFKHCICSYSENMPYKTNLFHHHRHNTTFDIQHLSTSLVANGFEKVENVYQSGEFSIRGGVIDIFLQGEHPYRIDVFGDHIESIHPLTPQRNDDTNISL